MVTIRPQGRSSLPNSKEIYCLLGKTLTMLKAHLQGSSCHFESMASIGLSEHEVAPMVSGNIADIFSLWMFHFLGLWFREYRQWWTNSLILKEDTPLLQERSFSPFTEASLMGWGALSSHPQPLVCGIRKSQDSS